AMTTSDRLILLHYMAHAVAYHEGEGILPTFMGKPFPGNTGNGLNTHSSLWDENGNNLFLVETDRLGRSHLASHFIAALLKDSWAKPLRVTTGTGSTRTLVCGINTEITVFSMKLIGFVSLS